MLTPRLYFLSYLSKILPLLILFVALGATYLLWSAERNDAKNDLREEFNEQAEVATNRITLHLNSYEKILRRTREQFTTRGTATRDKFHEHIKSLVLEQHYPGILSVEFEPLITGQQKTAHISAMYSEGFAKYDIKPEGERNLYAPVSYIEPFRGQNLRLSGFDRYSDAVNRKDMDRARDMDDVVISGKIKLAVGGDKNPKSGFLMYLPVYRYGKQRATLSERRANISGWITATFSMDDLASSMSGNLNSKLDVEILNMSEREDEENPMLDNHNTLSFSSMISLPQRIKTMQVGGHNRTILIRALPRFLTRLDNYRANLIVLIGLSVSILLSLLTWMLLRSHVLAIRTGYELEESKRRLQETLDNSPYMIWQKDVEGRYLVINRKFFQVTGKSQPEEVLGHTDFDLWPHGLAEKYRADDAHVMQVCTQTMIEELNGIDEHLFWVETCKTPILDSSGQVLGTTGFSHDITSRKLALEAIRQSESRFRDLFNGGNDAIYVVDTAQGNFIEVNDRACLSMGYSHEEMLRMGIEDIDDPAFLGAIPKMMNRIITNGSALFERVHLTRDGRKIPVEISAHRMEFNGKSAILSIVRDISERKAAELKFETILQTTPDGFWIVALQECRFLEVNPAYCDMSGYTRDELLQMAIMDIDANEQPEETKLHVQAVIEGRETHFETRHRHKAGHLIDVEISAKYMEVRGGCLVVFIRDITERKKVDMQKLRESEDRFRGTLEQAAVGIAHAQLEGYIKHVNQKFCDIVGYTRDELLSMNFREITFSDDLDKNNHYIQQLLAGNISTFAMEKRYVRKDGSLVWINLTVSLLCDADGNPHHTIGVVEDITERKRLERQMRDLSKHLQSVRESEKASFAREIHDNLGGTLTALKMDIYWLAEELAACQGGGALLEHVSSMSNLLDSAVDVTRRVITDLRPTILDDLGLLAAIEWQAGQFQKRSGIQCRVTCINDYESKLDKYQTINLFRIFQESLTNVVRHSGASNVEVELRYEESEIFLTIDDNGCGFLEGHTVSSTSYGILGMRERVEQLDGKIYFSVSANGGFSVRVMLPLMQVH